MNGKLSNLEVARKVGVLFLHLLKKFCPAQYMPAIRLAENVRESLRYDALLD
jgi:hypothetical protein